MIYLFLFPITFYYFFKIFRFFIYLFRNYKSSIFDYHLDLSKCDHNYDKSFWEVD